MNSFFSRVIKRNPLVIILVVLAASVVVDTAVYVISVAMDAALVATAIYVMNVWRQQNNLKFDALKIELKQMQKKNDMLLDQIDLAKVP